MAAKTRAAVVGATGYIGMQCVRLLSAHPEIDLVEVFGRSSAGQSYREAVPGSDVLLPIREGLEVSDVDVIFAALPHGTAASAAQQWLDGGAVVIDLSADFRIASHHAYSHWYGGEHPSPALLGTAAYALVELHRDELMAANLLAVPGCYPTATLLALIPALQAGLIDDDVVVDAKSGVSGVGRSPSMKVHFSEVNESVLAYGIDGHRHKAEMIEQLSKVSPSGTVSLTFVPHLVPMTRGILVTAYVRPKDGVSHGELQEPYREWAERHDCLKFCDSTPATKSVANTNLAAIHVGWQDGMGVITCTIDNLIKGAAGQAVQACNIRFGFPETTGLSMVSTWP